MIFRTHFGHKNIGIHVQAFCYSASGDVQLRLLVHVEQDMSRGLWADVEAEAQRSPWMVKKGVWVRLMLLACQCCTDLGPRKTY
jgi:hypothetical protein